MDEPQLKKLISRARKRGYVTYDELDATLPQHEMTSEQIEEVLARFEELGIVITECEENAGQDVDAAEAEPPETKIILRQGPLVPEIFDLILTGRIVRIAMVRDDKHRSLSWLTREPLSSRLFNRLAREVSDELYVGFVLEQPIAHLNHDIDEFTPSVAKVFVQHDHSHSDENNLFVITEAQHWWAELKMHELFEPGELTFCLETHALAAGEIISLLVPRYRDEALKFKCPPRPHDPDEWPDRTWLLRDGWDKEELRYEDKEIEPVICNPLSPTGRFRRSLKALFAELAAHGIYGVDHERNHLVMREIWAEIEPSVQFYFENNVDPRTDVPMIAVDTITQCDDENDLGFYTEVAWRDDYELRRRIGISPPEVRLSREITSDSAYFTATTEDRAREAMFLCKSLAPSFGLQVAFDGNVEVCATIWLDQSSLKSSQ